MSAQELVDSLAVPPLIHGDAEHQAWLKSELQKWVPVLERWKADGLAKPR